MKKIGLVGGISWISSLEYYKLINEGVNEKLGGLNYAECLVYSLNFGDIQAAGWPNAYPLLLKACEHLKKGGAEAILLCANTAHLFADTLQEAVQLPIIHIVDETAKQVKKQGFTKAGLLGTKFTMEMDFFRNKLETYGLDLIVPESVETRDYIQRTLKEELGAGILLPATKQNYLTIIQELANAGAECIILGCTEIPLLIQSCNVSIPLFNTTRIHADAAVAYIVS